MHTQVTLSLLAWGGLLACAGLAPGQQQQPNQFNLPVQAIGPNDLINVTIYKQPGLSGTQRVSSGGTVQLPMLKQEIKASGLLPGSLGNAITQAYVTEGILVDPQVTVNIVEYNSHPIHVGGAVRTPVGFQAATPVTLLEAINKAGGLSETAGAEILVTKSGEMTRRISTHALFTGSDESANITLTGGEEIRVPDAGRVYVIGNVKKPCNYLIKEGSESSVLKAMSYSEGLMAYSTKTAYIYRREAAGSKNEIEIPLHDIMTHKVEDVELLPEDILYVPENGSRKMMMNVIGKTLLVGGGALTSLAVYH